MVLRQNPDVLVDEPRNDAAKLVLSPSQSRVLVRRPARGRLLWNSGEERHQRVHTLAGPLERLIGGGLRHQHHLEGHIRKAGQIVPGKGGLNVGLHHCVLLTAHHQTRPIGGRPHGRRPGTSESREGGSAEQPPAAYPTIRRGAPDDGHRPGWRNRPRDSLGETACAWAGRSSRAPEGSRAPFRYPPSVLKHRWRHRRKFKHLRESHPLSSGSATACHRERDSAAPLCGMKDHHATNTPAHPKEACSPGEACPGGRSDADV